jgi:hypothetical protein
MVLDFWHDIRRAVRAWWSAPAFSALAVMTLAVGLGANSAVFSAASALLLRPLPLPQGDRVVFGVAGETATFAGVAIALAIIGLLACYVPARRAARSNPTLMLRSE